MACTSASRTCHLRRPAWARSPLRLPPQPGPMQMRMPRSLPQAVKVAADGGAFTPPGARDIPAHAHGRVDSPWRGHLPAHAGQRRGFFGHTLNCVNCHLDAGRLKGAAPMWGAYPLYPAYRKKTNHVDTFAERVRGCFMYSMNGKAPDDGHDILVALEPTPTGWHRRRPRARSCRGRASPRWARPRRSPASSGGAKVYEAKCALCHGAQARARNRRRDRVPAAVGQAVLQLGRGHA